MERLESRNIPYKIADLISNMIVKMELLPGERLLEGKLAKDLEVSQGAIREAFRILEKNGLVSINQRKGTTVTLLDENYIDTLYDIIADMYVLLTKKAALHYSEENKKSILDVIKKIESCAKNSDADGYYEGVFEFAGTALKISNDALLENLILQLWPNKKRIEYETISLRKDRLSKSSSYFQKIRKLIESSSFENIPGILRDFVQHEKKIAIELLKKSRS